MDELLASQTVSVPTVLVAVGRCLAPTRLYFLPYLPVGLCVQVAVGAKHLFHGGKPRGDTQIRLQFELPSIVLTVVNMSNAWRNP